MLCLRIFFSISDLFAFIPLLINYYREKKSQKEEEKIKTILNDENTILPITDEKPLNNSSDQTPDYYEVQSSKKTQRSIFNSSSCNDLVQKLLVLAVIFLFELLARSFYFIYHIFSIISIVKKIL